MSIIPGFMLRIKTWENDGDNYNTVDLPGLSEDHVNFFIKVGNLFQSYNRHGDGRFGNNEINGEALNDAIDLIASDFKASGRSIPTDWDKTKADQEWLAKYEDDFYSDPVYDLIGIWCEGERYRVFDGFKVFHVPSAIEEVTHKFKD